MFPTTRMFSHWRRSAVPAYCFSNDELLGKDFGSKSLIDNPRGRVYHTRDINTLNDNKQLSKTHKRLLSDTRICRALDNSKVARWLDPPWR